MKNETITTLVREYAEEIRKDTLAFSSSLPEIVEALIKNDQVYYGQFLQWLTRRYAIVEKEAVRKEYELAEKLWIKSACTLTEEFNRGRMNAIESLFPDLGKEVEE